MVTERVKPYRRRSASEWQALLSAKAASSLTIRDFCRQACVSTASFYRWQGLLESSDRVGMGRTDTVKPSPTQPPDCRPMNRDAPFLDLGVLSTPVAPRRSVDGASSRLELHLDLGAGVVLHVVRG